MTNPRVAVLASGEGTTAEAVNKVWLKNFSGPRIELIITNNPNAGILKRFPDIKSIVIKPDDEQALLDTLQSGNFDLIWLAGYMKKVGPEIVDRFGWHSDYKSPYQAMMVNIHPGLLPATIGQYGIHVQEFVLQNHLLAGHSLHVVSENFDEGPLLSEHMVKILPGDTAESLMARVQASEKKYLPADINKFIIERRKFLNG